MPIDLATLKTEIAKPAYAGMDEAAIARALSTPTAADGNVDTPREAITRTLVSRRISGKIKARIDVLNARILAAIIAASNADVSALETRLANLHGARDSFELLPSFTMSNAGVRTFVTAVLDALVAEGVMDASDKAALLALGVKKVTPAEVLFGVGTVVESGDVSRAKKV